MAQLESESIYIIREVAAEFANPVMLYSIGKDSSVETHPESFATTLNRPLRTAPMPPHRDVHAAEWGATGDNRGLRTLRMP